MKIMVDLDLAQREKLRSSCEGVSIKIEKSLAFGTAPIRVQFNK